MIERRHLCMLCFLLLFAEQLIVLVMHLMSVRVVAVHFLFGVFQLLRHGLPLLIWSTHALAALL